MLNIFSEYSENISSWKEAELLKLKYPIFKMAAGKIMGLEFT